MDSSVPPARARDGDRLSTAERRGLSSQWRVLVGVALALLAGEALSRGTVHFQYAWDADLGHIAEPGTRFRKWGEGSGSGEISRHGTRASEGASAAVASRTQVLVLGDSFSEAYQVRDDELFSNRLAGLLEGHGVHVQVTNAGRSGYSMADYVCRTPVFRRLFSPSWVVVQLNEWDFDGDAFDENTRLARFRRNGEEIACVPPALGPAPRRRGGPRELAHALRSRFTLPDRLLESLRARIAADRSGQPLFLAGQMPRDSPEEAPKHAVPIREELALLRSAWGSRLTLLYLPAVDPARPLTRESLEVRVEAAARELGIRYRSLREELPALLAERKLPYGFSNTRLNVGHMNRDGHAAAARVLHREFLELRANGLL